VIVALVGPPGVGKTTTLVKLAARYGLASRRPAHILTADVFRIAAAEQLQSLAAILGIGCNVVDTPVALAQALEEHRSKDFIFIDTPGLGRNEMEDGADLAHLIASHPEIDTHLVLSASMKPADMARVIDRYEMFQPKKLLFTRIDETERFGAIVSEASRRSLPVSFLTTGQQIPDDLEPATKERLAALIAGPAHVLHATGASA
jgi:flagellar biosynthesis protein FlhF